MCGIPPTSDCRSLSRAATPILLSQGWQSIGRESTAQARLLPPPPLAPSTAPLRGASFISILAGVLCVALLLALPAERLRADPAGHTRVTLVFYAPEMSFNSDFSKGKK